MSSFESEGDFRQWLIEMRPRLHRYCARMAGSVIDGDDLVQDAIVGALSAANRFASIERPDAWLFRIAHNAVRKEMRKRALRNLMPQEDLEMVEDSRSDTASRIAVAASVRSFLALVPSQRAAVVLKDVLGYSLEEICEVTDATLPAVKASLHRGRENLRLRADTPPATIGWADSKNRKLLDAYVDRFNAHDFAAVADMLANDVKLSLVGNSEMEGATAVKTYLGNYSRQSDWRVHSGFVDLQPAVLFYSRTSTERPTHFALINWHSGNVINIRDYRYARYVLEGAEVVVSS
ncbi:sigma-70 family RNA polymerase sigma factor [Mesorhizobium sp.]|uniref:sigma-70 family RNA polymerase sigma factor n=1 Tax=Mesorhizobium sp. TaxID=1871066 RepID=UPI00257F64F6|nr:sigma-70 family RNA polymerase sigma factor [Mesorhizobium sp.]